MFLQRSERLQALRLRPRRRLRQPLRRRDGPVQVSTERRRTSLRRSQRRILHRIPRFSPLRRRTGEGKSESGKLIKNISLLLFICFFKLKKLYQINFTFLIELVHCFWSLLTKGKINVQNQLFIWHSDRDFFNSISADDCHSARAELRTRRNDLDRVRVHAGLRGVEPHLRHPGHLQRLGLRFGIKITLMIHKAWT